MSTLMYAAVYLMVGLALTLAAAVRLKEKSSSWGFWTWTVAIVVWPAFLLSALILARGSR
jgi:hypothetical protein